MRRRPNMRTSQTLVIEPEMQTRRQKSRRGGVAVDRRKRRTAAPSQRLEARAWGELARSYPAKSAALRRIQENAAVRSSGSASAPAGSYSRSWYGHLPQRETGHRFPEAPLAFSNQTALKCSFVRLYGDHGSNVMKRGEWSYLINRVPSNPALVESGSKSAEGPWNPPS
jgi:hypothetical protein